MLRFTGVPEPSVVICVVKTASLDFRQLLAKSRKRFSMYHCSLQSSFNQVTSAVKKCTAINKEKRISRGVPNIPLLVIDDSYFNVSVIYVCASGGEKNGKTFASRKIL